MEANGAIKKMYHKKKHGRNKQLKGKEEKGKGIAKGTEQDKIKGGTKEEQYFDDIIEIDENTSKDFEFLLNAPVSENDHFVFKSEKDWSIDVSKSSEFFMLDLKTLSAAIESIPFNENVTINKKYFSDDQLTNIYNNAERGKEKYNQILSDLEAKSSNSTKVEGENENSLEDTLEDLDFLLSLQEPVNNPPLAVNLLSISCNTDSKVATSTSKPSTSTKPLDLEKWLDSVLDD